MDNRVREWYLFKCKKKEIKPTVRGLIQYWKEHNLLLDSKLINRIAFIYNNASIKCFEDLNKYPINQPY